MGHPRERLKSADVKPLEETWTRRTIALTLIAHRRCRQSILEGIIHADGAPRRAAPARYATREKLTKIYDAIDTTDSHDRGITIYEFRVATASLNMLYLLQLRGREEI